MVEILQVGARWGRVDYQDIASLLVDRLAFPWIWVLGSSGISQRGRGCVRPWRAPWPCPATTSWPCPGGPSGRREGRAPIYELSSGAVRPLDLTAPRDPHRPGPRELGNWPCVLAVIAPEN